MEELINLMLPEEVFRQEKYRKYYEKNVLQKKAYREANAERIKEYRQHETLCECGKMITRHNMTQHLKSIYHKKHSSIVYLDTLIDSKDTESFTSRKALNDKYYSVTCSCGCVVGEANITKHMLTQKHMKHIFLKTIGQNKD